VSATKLRQAATILRQRAKSATFSPWEYEGGPDGDGLVWANRLGDPVSGSTEPDDATYIALMDPSLGLLIADCLDAEARMLDMLEPFTELLCATIESQGGPTGALRLLKDDQGNPILTTDTTPSWVRVAEAIIERGQS
jgi:hypothetical protein